MTESRATAVKWLDRTSVCIKRWVRFRSEHRLTCRPCHHHRRTLLTAPAGKLDNHCSVDLSVVPTTQILGLARMAARWSRVCRHWGWSPPPTPHYTAAWSPGPRCSNCLITFDRTAPPVRNWHLARFQMFSGWKKKKLCKKLEMTWITRNCIRRGVGGWWVYGD